jgi:transcriptional regulator with XRE-family HTH domain
MIQHLAQKGGFCLDTITKILDVLKEKGKTQKGLTEFLGVSQSAFTDWKTGKTTSYTGHIAKIADFLGVSVDYLLGRAAEPGQSEAPASAEAETGDRARLMALAKNLSPEDLQRLLDHAELLADRRRQ